MRARTAVFVGVALTLLVFVARAFGPLAPEPAGSPQGAPAPVAVSVPEIPSRPEPLPARNVFEYADARLASIPLPAERPQGLEPYPESTPPPAVRLVGFVRRGGVLLAALALEGEVVLLGAGEQYGGYRIVAVDSEAGVRLAGPEGTRVLEPPR